MMSNMDKKGVLGGIMHVLIEITIIALIIAIFFFMSGKLYGAVFGGNANTDTIKSFDSLADNVQFMIDKPTSFEHQSMIIFIEEGYLISGLMDSQTLADYNAMGSTMVTYAEGGGYTTPILTNTEYPAKCKDQPCLCLYKIKNFPDNPIVCRTFTLNPPVVFHGYFKSERAGVISIVGASIGNLMIPPQSNSLYSDYSEELRLNYYHLALSNSGVAQNLYVEKFVKYGRAHILITQSLSQDEIDERIALLSLCPDNSDPGCVNVPINSNIGSGFCYYDQYQQKCVLKQGVSQCPTNTRLTQNCVCGSRFIDMTEWSEVFCYRRPSDDRMIAMKFNCNDLAQGCVSYCNATSKDTDSCSQEEIDFCNQNPCGFGPSISGNRCQVRQEGTKYYCEPVLS